MQQVGLPRIIFFAVRSHARRLRRGGWFLSLSRRRADGGRRVDARAVGRGPASPPCSRYMGSGLYTSAAHDDHEQPLGPVRAAHWRRDGEGRGVAARCIRARRPTAHPRPCSAAQSSSSAWRLRRMAAGIVIPGQAGSVVPPDYHAGRPEAGKRYRARCACAGHGRPPSPTL